MMQAAPSRAGHSQAAHKEGQISFYASSQTFPDLLSREASTGAVLIPVF